MSTQQAEQEQITRATGSDLVGRKIVAVDFRRFEDPENGWLTSPVLTLDDGRRVIFEAEETTTGEYLSGVGIYMVDAEGI